MHLLFYDTIYVVIPRHCFIYENANIFRACGREECIVFIWGYEIGIQISHTCEG